jgi:hypothetical protein
MIEIVREHAGVGLWHGRYSASVAFPRGPLWGGVLGFQKPPHADRRALYLGYVPEKDAFDFTKDEAGEVGRRALH